MRAARLKASLLPPIDEWHAGAHNPHPLNLFPISAPHRITAPGRYRADTLLGAIGLHKLQARLRDLIQAELLAARAKVDGIGRLERDHLLQEVSGYAVHIVAVAVGANRDL